jgi:hypothetical protein
MRGIAEDPNSVSLHHRAIVALASTGATEKARAMLREMGDAKGQEDDVASLEARLEKEHAFSVQGEERARHALTAATLYECIHARTSGMFSGINAAAMRLFAGDPERAAMLARQVLEACARERPASPEEAYYVTATEAEAALLLGDTDKAASKLKMVRLLAGDDHAARASLRKHLGRICDEKGLSSEVLEALKPPPVVHYAGDRRTAALDPAAERLVSKQIADYLGARKVGFGYGSLACGADILFAERLIARGAELCVVLPVPEGEFQKTVVEPAGEGWKKRFKACLESASSITVTGTDADECTEFLLAHGARIAMGLSILRAQSLDADLEQVVVWDGDPDGLSGDVATWQARGLSTFRIHPGAIVLDAPTLAARGSVRPGSAERVVCAMLFGELTGYGTLREPSVPVFVREVMGALGRTLDALGDDVLFRSTWGESLYIVLKSAPAAARCALDLQASMASIPLKQLRLPPGLSLRLGAHLGPVYRGYDPIAKSPSFFGMDVTRATRLKPVMPEGQVFVTEPFAAALMLEGGSFLCDYVGTIPAVRGLGFTRMYVLKEGAR